MSQSIESYGSGPMRDAGWGESDDGTGTSPDLSRHRIYVRDLEPGEPVPEHPAAARGYSYIVEDVPGAAIRLRDGAGVDIDDEARAATAHLAGDDPVLAYLLASQWAAVEHGAAPLGEPVDAADGEGFVPGELADGIYTYDCDAEDHDGDVQRLRFEVEVDDDLRDVARRWYERDVPPSRRRLMEVIVDTSRPLPP